jgi:hypothetical protein
MRGHARSSIVAIYDPYAILGVAKNCSVEDAKNAYRRLASKHHPDKGGSKEKFQEIKEAFELIERGGASTFVPGPTSHPNPPTPSSFTAGIKPKASPYAGKPAPGYEAVRKPIVYPHTARKNPGRYSEFEVHLTVTREQAERGCTVPFWHDGTMRDYVVQPFSSSHTQKLAYPLDAMVGRSVGTVTIEIHLTVES